MVDDALFCVCQKAFIEKDGKVLVLFDPVIGPDFPGGKLQEREAKVGDTSSLMDALKREVKEETSLEIEVLDPFAVWYYEFPKEHRNYPKVVYTIGFKCRYISGEVKVSDEHNKFEWVDKDSYKNLQGHDDYFGALKKYYFLKK